MKNKIALLLIFLLGLQFVFAKEELKEVPRLVYIAKSVDWYKTQANLWQKELKKDPYNSQAWYNYYKAYRYSNFSNLGNKEVRNKLSETINDMKKYVPDSFEYFLLESSNIPFGDAQRLKLLLKAFNLKPENPQTYYDLLTIYDFKGKTAEAKSIAKKLYISRDIATGLINYNYNVLTSLKENAILFTNGDNDTYPAWMLQKALNIRTDVTVLNLSLSTRIPGYLENKLDKLDIDLDLDALPEKTDANFIAEFSKYLSKEYPQFPVYFGLTVYENRFKNIKNNLYIIGLAYMYSESRIDNIAEIKKNIYHNYRLDYLSYDWYEDEYLATQIVRKLNNNYVAPILVLAEHLYNSNDRKKADTLINVARNLSTRAGMDIDFKKYFIERGIKIN